MRGASDAEMRRDLLAATGCGAKAAGIMAARMRSGVKAPATVVVVVLSVLTGGNLTGARAWP